jgi:SAM-dependent methyltransferase
MSLDEFERYKNNTYLSPITPEVLAAMGTRCGFPPASNVLDLACGKGETGIIFAEKFHCIVTGAESRPVFAEEARRRALFRSLNHLIHILDQDSGELPFDDDFYDAALMAGTAHPYDSGSVLAELNRVVRPEGWIILGELVWNPGRVGRVPEATFRWVRNHGGHELCEMNARIGQFEKSGYLVVTAELAGEEAWENYFAPQARAILENRMEHKDSLEAQAALDRWQEELDLYHSGGGKEALGYAYFLLQTP